MNVIVSEDKKNKIIFEIPGYGHTVCNLIRKELWADEHIKMAAYAIDHPLVEKPRIIVETDGADPRKTIHAAVKRVQKQLEKIKEEAKHLK